MADKIKVKYVHSPIGRNKKQKDTVKGLGFSKLGQVKEFESNPCIMGMINKIPHLVEVVKD